MSLDLADRTTTDRTARPRLVVDPKMEVPAGLTVEICLLTPAMAEEWLTANMRNRRERPLKQETYASDMKSGAWVLTGQSIQIDWNGQMIDGQNRCRAVIASGTPVPVMVVRGLDPDVRGVVDTGVARTTADTIEILHGLPNAILLAAVGRQAVGWDQGFSWVMNFRPSSTQVRNYVLAHTDALQRAIEMGRNCARYLPGSATFYGFLYYACAAANPDDGSEDAATEFFEALAVGDGLSANDPRLVLRNRLIRDAQLRGPAAEYDKRAMTFRAWNAWRDNEVVTKLQAPRGQGWTHKNFPRPY